MQLTPQHRSAITLWYFLLFYAFMMYKCFSGLWLFQLQPHVYNTRFDMVTWLLMKTGIHTWLLDNEKGWIIFDIVFYSMPLLYLVVRKKNIKIAALIAFLMLIVNWVYVECFTLYPSNSIESFTAWLLFPFLFMTISVNSFCYVLNALRYFFLFVFASAAVWKLIQYGLFNSQQMSGVLLYQHKEFLVSSPSGWYSSFIYWLIQHPVVGYIFYMAAALLELFFITGFFTKKYDRLLIALFLLFLFMNLLVMRIPYWELTPFVIPLLYSRFRPVYHLRAKTV